MKKNIFIILSILFWASLAGAQQDTERKAYETPFDGDIRAGYRWVLTDDNARAGEYEYLHSSGAGSLFMEWDPLPQRFSIESYYLNKKDFFGEMDYAFRDIVVLSITSRRLFHNTDHYSFGADDASTSSPSFTDRNPEDSYGIGTELDKAFIRFKAPDFPFHLYAEDRTVERDGFIQQRFLDMYSGSLNKVSETREINWSSREVRAGANTHFGPIEIDYNHREKVFEATKDKALYDAYATAIPEDVYAHNLVPDIESSSDTVKVHTSYTGRLVAAATYSSGDKKNQDSNATAEFKNTAGDVTYMPFTSLTMYVKYRHYDVNVDNPDTVTVNGISNATNVYSVRDSISSQKDVFSGVVRYRATDRLSLRGEYSVESALRDVWTDAENFWEVARRTTKNTGRLALSYRIMNKLNFRADYSSQEVDNPAYKTDPDKSKTSRASVTWSPARSFVALMSYGGVRGKRDELGPPLAGGSRETVYDQGLGSFTVLVGKRSSITASYLYLKNKVDDTITYTTAVDAFELETAVPYKDIAHVALLSLSHAYNDVVSFTAEGSKSYSRGYFRNSGSVSNTLGIAEFSDNKVIDSVYSAGIEFMYSKNAGSALRYQYRQYDDRIDDTQDGRVQTILATMSLRW